MTAPEKLFPNGPEWERRDGLWIVETTVGLAARILDCGEASFNQYHATGSTDELVDFLRTRIIAHRDELNRIIGGEG